MIILPLVLSAALAAGETLDSSPVDHVPSLLLSNLTAEPATAIIQDEEEEGPPIDEWVGQVTLGATFAEGNTDSTTVSAAIDAAKHYGNGDVWTLGLNWNYTEQNDADGTSIARRIEGRTKYDIVLDDVSYVWLNGNIQNDTPLDNDLPELDLRWTIGAGYGYKVIENDEWMWGLEAGLALFSEDFASSPTDPLAPSPSDQYLSARVASVSKWVYSEKTNFSNYLELYPSLEESDDVYGRSDTRATTQLTDNILGQFRWIWDWDNTPGSGRERSDHLFLITVGWGF